MKYFGNGIRMEYDFIVEPGADFSQIRISYEGAESILVNTDGELVVKTTWGEVIEQRPVIYQLDNNNKIPVEGKYLLYNDNSFSFEITTYNPTIALVIDPVLSFSSFYGGRNIDQSNAMVVDASGAAYITGTTWSSTAVFPRVNPFQAVFKGFTDAFVAKVDSSGENLIFSTYLGGNGTDFGTGISFDPSGSVYVTGNTKSTTFPTLNAFQDTLKYLDAFVTKLSSSGNSLIYSTYIGGADADYGGAIVVNNSGEAFITGGTYSNDYPTLNPFQDVLKGKFDGFVTKISSAGSSLIYSTYLGGSGDINGYGDGGSSIAIDIFGSAYITGSTPSSDFPVLNSFQDSLKGSSDAYVTKLNSSGDGLIYSTYLGGDKIDYGNDIVVNDFGQAFIIGTTSSDDFPILNPYQATNQSDIYNYDDAFVTKLGSDGDSLIFSTYLGGSANDRGQSIAIDTSGRVYVTGLTTSTDFPVFNSKLDFINVFYSNIFITKFNYSGDSLFSSTIFGGSEADVVNDIAVDLSEAIYLTGTTSSGDFPTYEPFQEFKAGSSDGFIIKFNGPNCCIEYSCNVNCSNDDVFDISDIVYFVKFMFKDGPGLGCKEEADVNADESIDISDIVFLVNFMFKEGPPLPNCP